MPSWMYLKSVERWAEEAAHRPRLVRPRPELPHFHQVAAGPLAAPAPTEIVALVYKCPMTIRIGADFQALKLCSANQVGPGGRHLRDNPHPAGLERKGDEPY